MAQFPHLLSSGVSAKRDFDAETRLLSVSEGAASPLALPDGSAATAKDVRRFTEPTVHTYADMQDLLLLDPIHDVDETGWPNAK